MNSPKHHTIYVGSDHAGFHVKQEISNYLKNLGYDVLDFGPDVFDKDDDYPDILHPLAIMLSTHPYNKAIVFGGSGTGEAIVLNRYPEVRCVQYYGGDIEIIEKARTHNNANALSVGARFVDTKTTKEAITLFLETHFNHQTRHENRIRKIESLLSHHSRDNSE